MPSRGVSTVPSNPRHATSFRKDAREPTILLRTLRGRGGGGPKGGTAGAQVRCPSLDPRLAGPEQCRGAATGTYSIGDESPAYGPSSRPAAVSDCVHPCLIFSRAGSAAWPMLSVARPRGASWRRLAPHLRMLPRAPRAGDRCIVIGRSSRRAAPRPRRGCRRLQASSTGAGTRPRAPAGGHQYQRELIARPQELDHPDREEGCGPG